MMDVRSIDWKNNAVKIVDQTLLPARLKYLYLKKPTALWQAIKKLKVRGAPALGAAGALGVFLGIKDIRTGDFSAFSRALDKAARYFSSARPTARNLFYGIERVCSVAIRNKQRSVPELKKIMLKEALAIIEEDRAACRSIGKFGSKLLKGGSTVLTICNAGALATIDYGTALGVIYSAASQGKRIKVFACETRPLLQGARITTWELKKKNIPVTLICDSMAATLMRLGKIDLVIAGADRIAANGDTANKIGTYNLAVLAHHHRIPFYVAAPKSTLDSKIESGDDIPIEERDKEEITDLFFKKPIAPKGIKVFNPAFDVTPHNLITAIITDKGIIKPPYRKNFRKALRE